MLDCPGIPIDTFSAFTERVYGDIFNKRIPMIGALEFTLRCNLRCIHCYCEGHVNGRELDTGEMMQVVDQLAEAGTMWLLVTGGEPLLRRGFTDIFSHIKKRGIFPVLFTNATLITADIADFPAEWTPFNLEISIYGATRSIYEKITRVAGSYDKCIRGIELLLDRGLKPGLKTMVMHDNLDELDSLHELAESYDLNFRFDAMLNASLGGGLEPTELRINPETVVELDRKYPERESTWLEFIEKFGDNRPAETLFSCGAGVNAFHIDPHGRLYPCTLARTEFFDLRQGAFEKGWEGFIRQFRMRRAEGVHACGQCSLRSLCGCCPGKASLETGELTGSVEYMCRIAALRALEFGGPVQKEAGALLISSLDSGHTFKN